MLQIWSDFIITATLYSCQKWQVGDTFIYTFRPIDTTTKPHHQDYYNLRGHSKSMYSRFLIFLSHVMSHFVIYVTSTHLSPRVTQWKVKGWKGNTYFRLKWFIDKKNQSQNFYYPQWEENVNLVHLKKSEEIHFLGGVRGHSINT